MAAWKAAHPDYDYNAHNKDPLRRKWHTQKHGAKYRGIEFKLTFEQWKDWWGEDMERRGNGKDDLVMARYNDEGAYELGNIKKITHAENKAEYWRTP